MRAIKCMMRYPDCFQWVIKVSHHTFYSSHYGNCSVKIFFRHTLYVYDDTSGNYSSVDYDVYGAVICGAPLFRILGTVNYHFYDTCAVNIKIDQNTTIYIYIYISFDISYCTLYCDHYVT